MAEIIPFPDQADPKKVGGYAIFQLIERAAAGARANGIRYPLSLPRDMASRGRVQSKETLMKSRYRLMRLSIVSPSTEGSD